MKMINKFFTIIFVLCFSFSGFAQAVENNFSLQDAINYGVENNYSFKNDELDADIKRQQAFEVMTEGFPKINAKIDYSYNFEQQVSLIPAGVFGPTQTELTMGLPHNATLQVDASQLIFDARYIYGMKARKGLLNMADIQVEIAEIDVRETIAKAYYAALVSKESYVQLESTRGILEEILGETREIYEQGFTDELSVNRLELNLSNLETQITNAAQQADNALMNLKYQIGMPQEETLVLTEDLNTFLTTLNFGLENGGTAEDRPEYQLFETLDKMRTYDIKQARSAYFPSFYAFASYGTNAQRDAFNFFNDQRWFDYGMTGFNVNIPIFDGLTARAQVQQRQIQKEQNLNEWENFKEGYALQTNMAQNNLVNAINEFNTQQENVALAEKILNKTVIMFNEGIGSSLELSQAQQEYTNTQINYSQAAYNLLVAQLELEKAKGNLK